MRADSSLSVEQREAAVAWFEQGLAADATARLVGAARNPVQRLYLRWRVRGEGALVGKSTKSYYSFEFKLELVERLRAQVAFLGKLQALSEPEPR